jgi:hypothetical protein
VRGLSFIICNQGSKLQTASYDTGVYNPLALDHKQSVCGYSFIICNQGSQLQTASHDTAAASELQWSLQSHHVYFMP